MDVQVVYVSKKGNTKKLADTIAKTAGVNAQTTEQVKLSDQVDILFIGGSIYAGKIDKKLSEFVKTLSSDKVKKVAVFSTSAGKATAFAEVTELLKGTGIEVCKNQFFCKGSFLLANRGRPNEKDLDDAIAFATEILKP